MGFHNKSKLSLSDKARRKRIGLALRNDSLHELLEEAQREEWLSELIRICSEIEYAQWKKKHPSPSSDSLQGPRNPHQQRVFLEQAEQWLQNQPGLFAGLKDFKHAERLWLDGKKAKFGKFLRQCSPKATARGRAYWRKFFRLPDQGRPHGTKRQKRKFPPTDDRIKTKLFLEVYDCCTEKQTKAVGIFLKSGLQKDVAGEMAISPSAARRLLARAEKKIQKKHPAFSLWQFKKPKAVKLIGVDPEKLDFLANRPARGKPPSS